MYVEGRGQYDTYLLTGDSSDQPDWFQSVPQLSAPPPPTLSSEPPNPEKDDPWWSW